VLANLAAENGAGAVWWSRAYDPAAIARDTAVKAGLSNQGIDARSFKGHVLFEPWTVETKTGGFYRVFTPMWKSVRGRELAAELPTVRSLPAPDAWPKSDKLADWTMGAAMDRGANVVGKYVCVGEDAARNRLADFIEDKAADYKEMRDVMAADGTSRLSENLTYGEISPRTCWHAGWSALYQGKGGAETFVKEVVWREFAYHLAYHTPPIVTGNWKPEWDAFPCNEDEGLPEVEAWKRGRTGIQLVDAAMRELYVTGTMQNRGRMIVASYLTKHLMSHWKIGLKWFEDCLIDWDPASNAMGWQWTAGCGPDASPYFRVFNPDTQAEKFDKAREYRARYLAEPFDNPGAPALDFFQAAPRSWGMAEGDDYPLPVVALDEGRKRALDAYSKR
jgi:deoxyribodipyrimidine photo-lyase